MRSAVDKIVNTIKSRLKHARTYPAKMPKYSHTARMCYALLVLLRRYIHHPTPLSLAPQKSTGDEYSRVARRGDVGNVEFSHDLVVCDALLLPRVFHNFL